MTIRGFLIAVLCCGLAVVSAVSVASAQIVEGPACDKEFSKVLNERAWMEGQREVEAAESIIEKPENSIMQYSCFKDLAGNNGENGSIVQAPLSAYVKGSFGNKKGGGSGGPCIKMEQIWKATKCKDFDKDWFMTFDELMEKDPRSVPDQCDSAARNKAWATAIKEAYPKPATPAAKGGMDAVQTYRGAFGGGKCEDSEIVPTGLSMQEGKTSEGEYTCSTPGCYYDPQTKKCQ